MDTAPITDAVPPAGAARAHRFLVLDSLRGVCAVMVGFGHLRSAGYLTGALSLPSSYLFVDFFFVLSGFVIAASYGDRLSQGFPIGRFMALRLGRVYPVHLMVLLVMLAGELALLRHGVGAVGAGVIGRQPFEGAHSPGGFAASLLLSQIFFGPDIAAWNGVAWSIAAEVWAYLLFAWIFRLAGRALVPVALVIACIAPFALIAVKGVSMDAFHDGALARCLWGFSLGILGYRAMPRISAWGERLSVYAATVLEIVLCAAGVALAGRIRGEPITFAAPLLFLATVLCFALERGTLSRLLRLRPCIFLGAVSYSFYMIHHYLQLRAINVLEVMQRIAHGRLHLVVPETETLGPDPIAADLTAIAIMAAALLAAWLSYRFIEHPARTWSRRLVLGERGQPAAIRRERDATTF